MNFDKLVRGLDLPENFSDQEKKELEAWLIENEHIAKNKILKLLENTDHYVFPEFIFTEDYNPDPLHPKTIYLATKVRFEYEGKYYYRNVYQAHVVLNEKDSNKTALIQHFIRQCYFCLQLSLPVENAALIHDLRSINDTVDHDQQSEKERLVKVYQLR